MKKSLKKIILIIAAIVALIVAGIIMYALVLRPAFFDYEEYDLNDVISIASVMPEDGYHLAAGMEMDASYYNIEAVMKDGRKVPIAVVYTNGDLEIHGNGEMKNYTSGLLPWEDDQILYLIWI